MMINEINHFPEAFSQSYIWISKRETEKAYKFGKQKHVCDFTPSFIH